MGFDWRTTSLPPAPCVLPAPGARSPPPWLGMLTSVAGILRASCASARRRSGAGAEQAESRRPPFPQHQHPVRSHLWPGCSTPSKALLKEKLEISLQEGICECKW